MTDTKSDDVVFHAEIRHQDVAFWAAFAEASKHDVRAQPYKDLIRAVDALPVPRVDIA